jgi:hypothetical protein
VGWWRGKRERRREREKEKKEERNLFGKGGVDIATAIRKLEFHSKKKKLVIIIIGNK